MAQRTRIFQGTRRSVVLNILRERSTVEESARIVCVQPRTVQRWVAKYGEEVRANYMSELG